MGVENQDEEIILLKNVKPGEIFRFATSTFEEAGREKDALFFQVIPQPAQKPDCVTIMTTDGKIALVRDGIHQVIIHPSKLIIYAAPKKTRRK